MNADAGPLARAAAPVQAKPAGPPRDDDDRGPLDGTALCLSGGGYRAMLFHLGALVRLNEAGLLPRLDRVSSVSGGSIAAGVLALGWNRLAFGESGAAANFDEVVTAPLRRMARRTIDWKAILLGTLLPGTSGGRLAGAYRRYLFGRATLQDLPDRPQFVFNATNLQSGALWRFSKAYLWDYRVGEVAHPRTELATAVAASSAFPPFLSPVVLRFGSGDYVAGSGDDLQRPEFTDRVVVTDGGVYDNLGLETAWKRYRTVLVSDGGGHLGDQARPRHDWLLQAYRVLGVIDNQVRSLRKRQLVDGFRAGLREGTYWGIRSDVADYALEGSLPAPVEETARIAAISTRLARLGEADQERLVNWGYAICDTALRKHLAEPVGAPRGFPYPRRGVSAR
ncbi:MAG TPA: patatin-like phospholipase family protein [Gaiellaceae bacterium]|nr:patatin-like phospholipase family protein [Gaiellaceae bacterium]